MENSEEFDDLFADECLGQEEASELSAAGGDKPAGGGHWKILVVDDDDDVHAVTRMALEGFMFNGKPITILEARSNREARQTMTAHPDVALLLVDVVMENDTAGLDLVDYIRNELDNHSVRIVLRTGQPGMAPEKEVVAGYEIDDYKSKTELTSEKLMTAMMVGLRNYEAMNKNDKYRHHLEAEVARRTASLQQAMEEIKMLRGIIPICSYCKKIRDDEGYWNQFEAYVQRYSDARFSHGICPSCARKHYPDFNLTEEGNE